MSAENETLLKNYLIQEYVEDYVESRISRREALQHLAALTGSLVSAGLFLEGCVPGSSSQSLVSDPSGVRVPENDPAIVAAQVQFPNQNATIRGYLARPKGDTSHAAVLVCHENRGLVEHIKDVTRRVAKAGYVGLAVDLLSRGGGTDKITDPAQVSEKLGNGDSNQFVGDFQAGIKYLKTQAYVRGDRIGMTGFCFGGGVTWLVAVRTSELKGAVPFYGPNPPLEEVKNIQAPVRAIYGGLDERINSGIPAIEEAMKQNKKTFEKVIYPNANHAFHNDTGPRYNAAAAKDAWGKALGWFDTYLK